MQDIRDITSTTFGLIIAYLLPGLTVFYAMSFWSPQVENWFDRVVDGNASVGLILFMIFGALVFGLQLSIARSLVFESIICRECRFDATVLAGISDPGKFSAYRLLVDEQLRYHQFWGAMAFAQPVLFYAWITTQQQQRMPACLAIFLAFLCEGATVYAAIESLKRYASARRNILSSNHNA